MHDADALGEAEKFLHERIPLTRAMGVRVAPSAEDGFAIEAPVSANSNHLATAFGGSINAVATLAAYALLWLELRDPRIELVVAESSIRFLAPVREMIRAICAPPAPDIMAAFKSALLRNGKGRIALLVTVEENGVAAARFTGTFVAVRKS